MKKYWPRDKFTRTYWRKERAKRLEHQNGKCAICGRYLVERLTSQDLSFTSNDAYLDHSSESGQLRGVLCPGCNTGIGCFEEDPTRLLRAIQYINKWKKQASLRLEVSAESISPPSFEIPTNPA